MRLRRVRRVPPYGLGEPACPLGRRPVWTAAIGPRKRISETPNIQNHHKVKPPRSPHFSCPSRSGLGSERRRGIAPIARRWTSVFAGRPVGTFSSPPRGG